MKKPSNRQYVYPTLYSNYLDCEMINALDEIDSDFKLQYVKVTENQ